MADDLYKVRRAILFVAGFADLLERVADDYRVQSRFEMDFERLREAVGSTLRRLAKYETSLAIEYGAKPGRYGDEPEFSDFGIFDMPGEAMAKGDALLATAENLLHDVHNYAGPHLGGIISQASFIRSSLDEDQSRRGIPKFAPRATKQDQDESNQVSLYVDTENRLLATSAAENFRRALGFLSAQPTEPVEEIRGSWWIRLRTRASNTMQSDEAHKQIASLKEALEIELSGRRRMELDVQAASIAKGLIDSLQGIDNSVAWLGPIVVVKITKNEVSNIAVRQLSADERRAMERYPELQVNPEKLLMMLGGIAGAGLPGEAPPDSRHLQDGDNPPA